jgi:ribosomal protein S18 acetylase RimI-like enzyme
MAQNDSIVNTLIIRHAHDQDFSSLVALNAWFGFQQDEAYIAKQYAYHNKGERTLLVAHYRDTAADGNTSEILAYCIYNRFPKYKPYLQNNIPEIQDLKVLPDYRNRGIAQMLIATCEDIARHEGRKQVGISFSISPRYGIAQRLYIKLGYIPDGNGTSYDRIPVQDGAWHAVDEQHCLMLVKDL